MEKLTMQEEEAMRWIWRIGPCFVKDVLAKYEDPKPPYTTLASVIKNFFAKDQKISTDDLKDIIDLIEKGKE